MALSALKTWIVEILNPSDLNAEFAHIYNNGQDVAFPATKAVDFNGQTLILDGDQDTSMRADTDDQIDFRIGGTDVTSVGTEGFQGQADIIIAGQVFGD